MNTSATHKIASDHGLSMRLLDQLTPEGYCPGFRLFTVTADGEKLLMAGDDEGSVRTRLFFAGIDDRTVDVQIERIGENPDVAEWERTNPHY